MKTIHRIGILCLLLALLTGSLACRPETAMRRYSRDIHGTFDTIITFIAYCESEEAFAQMENHVVSRYEKMHQLFDLYNAYPDVNNVHTINEQAGMAPVQVEPELIELIEKGMAWYQASPGKTNIAMGPVLSIWHDYRSRGLANAQDAKLPDIALLEAAAAHTEIDRIVIDSQEGTVFLPDANMRLDLGAIAKGYATETIAQELIEEGYESFIISGGGNVRTVGRPLDRERSQWNIGIQNPDPQESIDGGQILDTAYVSDLSLVTSGDYQRYYRVDGVAYHHIIDPETLFPGSHLRAVTIATEDSGWADFLSTTLFLMPYEEGFYYIESIPEAEALWVLNDGSIEATDGMRALLKELGGAVNLPPQP